MAEHPSTTYAFGLYSSFGVQKWQGRPSTTYAFGLYSRFSVQKWQGWPERCTEKCTDFTPLFHTPIYTRTCRRKPLFSLHLRAGDGARTHDSHVGNVEPSILKLHSGNDLHPETPSACCPACRTPAEDADLGRIVEAWPNLPPAIKAGIMALVQASALAGNIWARSEDHEWESSR